MFEILARVSGSRGSIDLPPIRRLNDAIKEHKPPMPEKRRVYFSGGEEPTGHVLGYVDRYARHVYFEAHGQSPDKVALKVVRTRG